MLLTLLLQPTNDPAASKLIHINEDSINEVGHGTMIIKVDVVCKKSRVIFLTPGARLAFIKLGQAFNTASILHHLDLNFYIQIETDALGYIINEIFSQLIWNS